MRNTPSTAVRIIAVIAATACAATAWLVWLPWHAPKVVIPDTTEETGPYSTGQVTGLVLTLVVAMFVGAFLCRWTDVLAGLALGLCGASYVDWSTGPDPEYALLGVILLGVGGAFVGSIIGVAATTIEQRLQR